MSTQPGHYPRWAGLIARVAAAAALTATVLSTPAGATEAAARSAAVHATDSSQQQNNGQLTLPGLRGSSHTVTLVTGDQVILTAAGNGRYTVATDPVSPKAPGMTVTATGNAHGTRAVYTIPNNAQELVNAHLLDPGLFDVQYLATHGDANAIPVTLHYTGHLDATALTAKVAALPGATPDAVNAAAGNVELHVTATKARAFWTALTGQQSDQATTPTAGYPLGKATPQLSGATTAWLTSHQFAAPTSAHPSTTPLYQVTQTVRLTQAVQTRCGTFCLSSASLFALTGTGADNLFAPTHVTCNSPCTTWQLTYEVPAGVYSALGGGYFEQPSQVDQMQWVDLAQPQLTVAADTSFTQNLDHAQQATVSTPQPAQPRQEVIQDVRWTPGNTAFASTEIQGFTHVWAVPSPKATVGTFHLSTQLILDRPQLTMAATGPTPLALHPQYPTFLDASLGVTNGSVRFTGRQTLPLVSAGTGTTQDFASVDARGKLVLLRTTNTCTGWNTPCASPCNALRQQMGNALQAGAAGVVFDAVYDPTAPGDTGTCARINIQWFNKFQSPGPPPALPMVLVSVTDAAELRARLASGTVDISVADNGDSPYSYNLKFYDEQQVPDTLAKTVSSDQLSTVHAAYHLNATAAAKQPVFIWNVAGEAASNDYLIGTTGDGVAAGSSRDEYYGPVSPDKAWLRWSTLESSSTGGGLDSRTTWDVLGQRGGSRDDSFFEEPVVPGATDPYADVQQAEPGKLKPQYCAGCRQGNVFYPLAYPVGSNPRQQGSMLYGVYPFWGTTHLYQGGIEIPRQAGAIISYPVPPSKQAYQLTQDAGNSHTAWNFTSAAPTSDQTPSGYTCLGTYLGVSSDPCQAEPLIYLRYDASLDLNDAITAPGDHQLQVTAYHQDSGAPAVTDLRIWTSTDNGTTWQAARVTGRNGSYTAVYSLPSVAMGSVSIRAQASDAAGNDVTQTITDAYGIATASQ